MRNRQPGLFFCQTDRAINGNMVSKTVEALLDGVRQLGFILNSSMRMYAPIARPVKFARARGDTAAGVGNSAPKTAFSLLRNP